MNINRDYLIKVDRKSATVEIPNSMSFRITDIKTSNIYCQLVTNESSSDLVKKYTAVENASDYEILLRVIKPNNEPKEMQFILIDEYEAFFMVDLTEDFKDYIGTYRCELFVDCMVNGELERITTSSFSYKVAASIMNNLDEVIEGDPDYPLVEEILSKLEGIDTDGLATEEYVNEAINNIEIPEVDLSGYATEEYVDNAIANIPGGSGAPTDNPVFTGSISLGRKEGTQVGDNSFAVGYDVEASGDGSHAEGQSTIASNSWSHAEGFNTTASGYMAHAEGQGSKATAYVTHAEGYSTTASGEYSHAEGIYTIASGSNSHAEGGSTIASGSNSHAEGYNTIANSDYQHVQGKYNKTGSYAHIVGNGTSDSNRKNAHTLDWDGNAWYQGNVYVGGTSQDNSNKLATELYIDNAIANIDIECNIPVIGGKEDVHIFTPDDVPDNSEGVYLFRNVELNGGVYIETLMTISTYTGDDNIKWIDIIDTWGNDSYFYVDENGELVLDFEDYHAWYSELEQYAPIEYVDDKIGDIEAALSAILGGEDNE